MTTFIYGNMSETHLDRFIPGDFDGDDKTDITTIAPLKTANGSTYLALQIRRKSSDGSSSNIASIRHPELGAIPVSGDYDGDGKSDFAVWQIWQFDDGDAPAFLVKQSSDGQSLIYRWGAIGDLPIASLEVR